MAKREPKTVPVDLMLTAKEYQLIYTAAAHGVVSRETFIVRAAVREAARALDLKGAK